MTNLVLHFTDPNKTSITLPEYGRDISTSLVFDGYYSTRYAQSINQALLYLLENFAGPNPPPNPIAGQMWYDNYHQELKFLNADEEWKTLGGIEFSETEPQKKGLWYNTLENLLYVWNGTQYESIGQDYFHLDGDNLGQEGSPFVDFSPPLNRITGPLTIEHNLTIDGDLTVDGDITTVENFFITENGALYVDVLGYSASSPPTNPDQWSGVESYIQFIVNGSAKYVTPNKLFFNTSSTTGLRLAKDVRFYNGIAKIDGVSFTDYTSVIGYTSPEGWVEGVKSEPSIPTSLVPFSVLRDRHEELGGIPSDGVERDGSTPMTGPLKIQIDTESTPTDEIQPLLKLFSPTSELILEGSTENYKMWLDSGAKKLCFENDTEVFFSISVDETDPKLDFNNFPVEYVFSDGENDALINLEEADEILSAENVQRLIDGRAVAWCTFDIFSGLIISSFNIKTLVANLTTGLYSFEMDNTNNQVFKGTDLEPGDMHKLVVVVTAACGLLSSGTDNVNTLYGTSGFSQGDQGATTFQHLRIVPLIYVNPVLSGTSVLSVHIQLTREETYYYRKKTGNTDQYFRTLELNLSNNDPFLIKESPLTKYITFACYNK